MPTLRPENVIKTVDNLGRITLPKGLRDRMYINSDNNELEIFTMEVDDRMYICLTSPDTVDNRLYAAAEIFKELDVPLPEEFQEKIREMEAKRHAYSGKKV